MMLMNYFETSPFRSIQQKAVFEGGFMPTESSKREKGVEGLNSPEFMAGTAI